MYIIDLIKKTKRNRTRRKLRLYLVQTRIPYKYITLERSKRNRKI